MTLEHSYWVSKVAIKTSKTNSLGLIFPSAISEAGFCNAVIYHAFHSVGMSSVGKIAAYYSDS